MPSKYLGNMIIALQSLAATLEHFCHDDVCLLVDENFKELIELCFGSQCSLMVYSRRAVGAGSLAKRASEAVAIAATLRRKLFDCAVDFDGTVISARLMRLARCRQKIGPGFAKRPGVYSRIIPADRDAQHCFDDFRLMAEAAGAQVADHDYLRIPLVPDTVWPDSYPHLANSAPIICIHPSATKDYKQWNIAGFTGLADRLLADGARVILVGAGESERIRIANMLGGMHYTPLNLHGRLSILQLTYLFQHAQLFIGNDSGPMHLATAAGARVIALFGPTELLRWRPRSPRAFVVKGLEPCSPACRPEACLHAYRCLNSITVEQIMERIDTFGDE